MRDGKKDQRVLHGKGDPRKYLKRNKWQIERKTNKIPNQKKNKYQQRKKVKIG